jgi:hypothetical protein
MSLPVFGSKDDAPTTTGSITIPVEVQKPLPPTLAYSDAAKIGQAAAATFWLAEGFGETEWINATTGSSGILERAEGAASEDGTCRPFSTIVTSIGGVHRYAGDICPSKSGRPVLRIGEDNAKTAS